MSITAIQLHESLLEKAKEIKPGFEWATLDKEILMECCENVMASEQAKELNFVHLQICTLQAFQTSTSLFSSLINGMIPKVADTVNVNYREHSFSFDKNSPIVTNFQKK